MHTGWPGTGCGCRQGGGTLGDDASDADAGAEAANTAFLGVVQDWIDLMHNLGNVVTKMPAQYPGGGELAGRLFGPGTGSPNEPPPPTANWYILAPTNVRDAYHALDETAMDSIVNALGTNLDDFAGGLGLPTLPDIEGFLSSAGTWIVGGVAVVALLWAYHEVRS